MRFVVGLAKDNRGWPAVAIILLFVIHLRSGRGLKLALGEAEVQGTDAGEAIPPPAV